MKKLITTAAAATLLLAAPLATFAHEQGPAYGRWGPQPYASHPGNGWQHGHYNHGYGPAYVVPYAYYPVPRVVVAPPVYVPVPAPVVALPAPYPAPYPPVNSVNIGFRLFF